MNKGLYKIIQLSATSLLVVILSYDMTEGYWTDLKSEIADYKICDAEVYFDFLYRNGLRNRFFKSQLSGNELLSNSLKRCAVSDECLEAANSFFENNREVLDNSTLSSVQKAFILNR